MESWDFLSGLGVDLPALKVSMINELWISSAKGTLLKHSLPLGGFGISRYILDAELVRLARQCGVIVEENTKVNDITYNNNEFAIDAGREYTAAIVAGSFGKRSNVDVKWKRPFAMAKKNKLNNYVGIKYHIQVDHPVNTIALHNFKDGYCGIVKIEGDKYNLCYLTTAANLQRSKGQIKEMEERILSVNPYLKKIFTESKMLFQSPLTISQISFDLKSQVENHVLMIGDAAGMITPLCGNGMSMALHASKLVARQANLFLSEKISRDQMEENYTREWKDRFSRRLATGRRIQRLFSSNRFTGIALKLIKPFPRLVHYLIKQTHGQPF
jgi:flavin-dependent dehydrogenase